MVTKGYCNIAKHFSLQMAEDFTFFQISNYAANDL